MGCIIPPRMYYAMNEQCIVLPRVKMPYKVFPNKLYDAKSLYLHYQPGNHDTYYTCYDTICYERYMALGKETSDIKETLCRMLHDHSIGNALDQFIKGKYVAPGTQIEAESPVDLLLGLSPDDNQTYIPYLIGFTLPVARDNIFENSLNLGNVTYDETVHNYQDSLSAVVYQQTPAYHPGAPTKMGTTIHLKLTTSQAKIAAR